MVRAGLGNACCHGSHAHLGDQLFWLVPPLVVLSAALVWLERRRAAGRPPVGPSALPTVVAGLAVVAALAAGVQVYRVGDSGAKAVWGSEVASSSSSSSSSSGD